ncbi:MAG: TetR/AcrR family transcriptional regulator [bacterium]|nr:TetR/AcrR family transcriptional regulator [bacterium]
MYIKSNKRKLQAANTRQNIYRSASYLITQRGFDNVTVEEIAENAGVSVGAFYHHFKSKEYIIAHYFKNLDLAYQQFFNEFLETPLTQNLSSIYKIMIFMIFAVKVSSYKGSDYLRIFYVSALKDQKLNSEMSGRDRIYFKVMRNLIETAIKHGELAGNNDIDPEVLINNLWTISRGCIIGWAMDRYTEDVCIVLRSCLFFFMKGLTGNKYPSEEDTRYCNKNKLFDKIEAYYEEIAPKLASHQI